MKFPFAADTSTGFSLPEVLISSLLLSMVVLNSTSIYTRSITAIRSVSLRDATYSLIANDIAILRAKTWRFGCEGLHDDGSPVVTPPSPDPKAASCTGFSRDASDPLAYKSGRSTLEEPYKNACAEKSMAQAFMSSMSLTSSLAGEPLSWTSNSFTIGSLPAGLKDVTVIRKITPISNRLEISYQTTTNSPVRIQIKTSLVPQASRWCP